MTAGSLPTICICFLSYTPSLEHPRVEYARTALKSTLDNLRYSGPLAVHFADDGSPPEFVDEMWHIAGGYSHLVGLGRTNAARKGYGHSFNLATQAMHDFAEVILPLEDDWELPAPLNLDPLVEALAHPQIECIRLGRLGYTQELRGTFLYVGGSHYVLLYPHSAEPHVFSGNPRLETRAFERQVGPWPEGLSPGATEFEVAHRQAARQGVVWPVDLTLASAGVYQHIGTVSA